MSSDQKKPLLVIVTGLSGAGNSTALAALADGGMYCIDNLPLELLPSAVDMIENGSIKSDHGFAICMDTRASQFPSEFPKLKLQFKEKVHIDTIFLTATQSNIATRYSATRRRHPLLREGETLREAIANDKMMLSPIESAADIVIDTTNIPPQSLKKIVTDRYREKIPPKTLHLTISSFGFKYGQLRATDSMYDVRFLSNPFYDPKLAPLTGLSDEIRDFVLKDERSHYFMDKIVELNRFLLPQYYDEGKHYFRIAIGCSGGRHRSVVMAEELGRRLMEKPVEGVLTTVIHRDIDL